MIRQYLTIFSQFLQENFRTPEDAGHKNFAKQISGKKVKKTYMTFLLLFWYGMQSSATIKSTLIHFKPWLWHLKKKEKK